jgi:glycosyltransferase involved in cell wall biosynthesis
MPSTPTLTIGLPVFNGARFLRQTIDSVRAQTFSDFELLISDNASTDETSSIARSAAEADGRITYRRNELNIGLARNLNLLVPLASGRLFKWAAADDVLRPTYLERCVAAIDSDRRAVLAYPQTDFVDGEGEPLEVEDPGWRLGSDDPAERLAYVIRADQYVNSILGVIRTSALRRTRLIPLYAGGDYRLLAELSLQGTFLEIPDRLYVRRIHAGSSKGNAHDRRWLRRYLTGARGEVRAPYWHLCRDHAGIVARAPLPVSRRLALLAVLTRTMVSRRARLFAELAELVRD